MNQRHSAIDRLSARPFVCLVFLIMFGASQTAVEAQEQTKPPTVISGDTVKDLPNQPREIPNLKDGAPKIHAHPASGFVAKVQNPPGLNTIVFEIPRQGSVEIYLPNLLVTGGSFTTTVKLKPFQGAQIKDISLLIGDQIYPLRDGKLDVILPERFLSAAVVSLTKNGAELVGVDVPIAKEPPETPFVPTAPTSATAGDVLVITGPAKGKLNPDDYVKIGGKPMQILASSSGSLVTLNTFAQPGITEIETRIENKITKQRFRNVTLEITADALRLQTGQSTNVHITVRGLEDLSAPARMTVNASGVVSMVGGNSQTITIPPSSVLSDGTYKTDEKLIANSQGAFGVKVVVTVDEKNP